MFRKIIYLILIVIVAGCGGKEQPPKDKKKLEVPAMSKFFTVLGPSDFESWGELEAGMSQTGKDKSIYQLKINQISEEATQEYSNILEESLKDGTLGISIIPSGWELTQTLLQKAGEKRIPTLCLFSDIPESNRLACIKAEPVELGNKGAEALNRLVYGSTAEIVILADVKNPYTEKVIESFSFSVAENAVIINTLYDEQVSLLKEIVQSNKRFRGILALNYSLLQKAMNNIQDSLSIEDLALVVLEITPSVIKGIENKQIDAAVGFQAFVAGLKTMETLIRIAEEGEEKVKETLSEYKIISPDLDIVTPETLEQYRMKLYDMGAPVNWE